MDVITKKQVFAKLLLPYDVFDEEKIQVVIFY